MSLLYALKMPYKFHNSVHNPLFVPFSSVLSCKIWVRCLFLRCAVVLNIIWLDPRGLLATTADEDCISLSGGWPAVVMQIAIGHDQN